MSSHKVRLSNRYINQTRLKVCLENRDSGLSLCLDHVLVSMEPDRAGSVLQVLSPVQVFNVRPPNFLDGGHFNFEYWIRQVSTALLPNQGAGKHKGSLENH